MSHRQGGCTRLHLRPRADHQGQRRHAGAVRCPGGPADRATPAELLEHDIPICALALEGIPGCWAPALKTDERTLDGRPITIEGDYICLYDSEGRFIGHFGIQRDITHRRQEENEVLRSRQELRDLTARLQAGARGGANLYRAGSS